MNEWHRVGTDVGHNGFGEIDPYIDWAFGADTEALSLRAMHKRAARFPLMLHLNRPVTIAQFVAGEFFAAGQRPADWAETVFVPAHYLDGGDLGPHTYFTAFVRKAFFEYFKERQGQDRGPVAAALFKTIVRMTVSQRLLDCTMPGSVSGLPGPPLVPTAAPTGQSEDGTVVNGIIDDGIAFANSGFRTAEDRSRVEFVWLQDGCYNSAAARYGYGRVLSKNDDGATPGLDSVIAAATHSGLVDEDEVYAETGSLLFRKTPGLDLQALALRASHGTFVAGLACGYPPGRAPRTATTVGEDSRPIVCAQLPTAVGADASGASLDTFAIDGVRFILDKADEIARQRKCGRLPVVINFSYGTIAGRHDGTQDIERAIDELILARRGANADVQVVIAAGNARLQKCHAIVQFDSTSSGSATGQTKTLKWQVLPETGTVSHLEIWLPPCPKDTTSRVNLRVTPPLGKSSPAVEEHVRPVYVWGSTPTAGMCYVRYNRVPTPTDRGMYLVTLKPTVPTEDPVCGQLDGTTAEPGIWTIALENVALEKYKQVHAWIQRNDTPFGHLPFGRQSYFIDPAYQDNVTAENGQVPLSDNADSMTKRAGTLNAIATGRHSIGIGAFRRSDRQVSDYSGEGPTCTDDRPGPDAVAPGDDSVIHGGVIGAGNRSGSSIALNGTSVAAPLVTRKIADLMAAGQPSDRAAIQAIARAAEAGKADTPPEARGGQGRLDLPGELRVLRREPSA